MATIIQISNEYWNKLQKNQLLWKKYIDSAYNSAIKDYVKLGEWADNLTKDQIFKFDNFPYLNSKAKTIQKQFVSNLKTQIDQMTMSSWDIANEKTYRMIDEISKTSKLPKADISKFKNRNLEALQAFQNRKIGGLGLSGRVWRMGEQFQQEVEMSLDLGMGTGRSAQKLSQDIRQNLREPNKLFRRYRDKNGVLRLSANAKAYHPGRGVYRSSYKNAMRVTRTETNNAYRAAEHTQRMNLPFIKGVKISLSNNHTINGVPFVDICDDLMGNYPKHFKFTGWHPQCRCIETQLLMTDDEYDEWELGQLRGENMDQFAKDRSVKSYPKNFADWYKQNGKKFNDLNRPWFVRDNFKSIKKIADIDPMTVMKKGVNDLLSKFRGLNFDDNDLEELLYASKTDSLAEGREIVQKFNTRYKNVLQDIKDNPYGFNAVQKEFGKDPATAFTAAKNKYTAGKNSIPDTEYLAVIEKEIHYGEINAGKYVTSQKMLDFLNLEKKLTLQRIAVDKELSLVFKHQKAFLDDFAGNKAAQKMAEKMGYVNYDTPLSEIQALNKQAEELIDKLTQEKALAEQKAMEAFLKKRLKNNPPDYSPEAYSQERKDAAMWAKTPEEADAKVRDVCGAVWRSSPKNAREAIWRYTGEYSVINEPLRNIGYYGSKSVTEAQKRIPLMTKLIDKSSYDFDMWVQRGVGRDAILGMFEVNLPSFDITDLDVKYIAKQLVGKIGTDGGFGSCGIAKGRGFVDKPVILNVYAPKGTRMMYAEPYSQFGGQKVGMLDWDGITKQSYFGHESEIILQRSTSFRITKVEWNANTQKWYIDVDVVAQNLAPLPG